MYIYIYGIHHWPEHNQKARWKQSLAIKQLLETLFLAIEMCTDFTTDGICINTMCAVSVANHLRVVADAFRPLRTHQHYLTNEK